MYPFPAKPHSHPGCHTTLSTVSSHSVFGWVKLCFSVLRVEVFSLNWELLKSTISCFLPRKYLLLLLSLWVIGTARVQPPSKPTTSGLDWLHCAHIVSSHRPLCVASSGWENSNFSFFLFKPTMKPLRNSRDWSKSPPFPTTPPRAPLSLTHAPPRLSQRGRGSWTGANAGGAALPAALLSGRNRNAVGVGYLTVTLKQNPSLFACLFVSLNHRQAAIAEKSK